jgi:adenine-specific DNA-methyltransferase
MKMSTNTNPTNSLLEQVEGLDREDLIKLIKNILKGGVTLTFYGKHIVKEIVRKVRPRVMRRDPKLHVGSSEEQAKNLLIEGENLQAMVTLYKYWGQIDLILTDPPFNTGQYFRYNDKWDIDPNDPGLGEIVSKDDGTRHTKWIKAMLPRLHMMKKMLKPQGVVAICIDDNELFHLGMMMDEVFGEENRLGIINWQKSYSPKSQSEHISKATEYVLVYSKDKSRATKGLEPRTQQMSTRYSNSDNDPNGAWASDNPIRPREGRSQDKYAIQSPFTGALHYPGSKSWRVPKRKMKALLEEWGTTYVEKSINDGRAKALVIKDGLIPNIPDEQDLNDNPVVEDNNVFENEAIVVAREKAQKIQNENVLPILHFLKEGYGRPRIKRYEKDVKKGKVPLTYWADQEYDVPFQLDNQSWDHQESGHSQTGVNELDSIVGKEYNFETVKPLKLFSKIIQLWCPNSGMVLDPYAGSGTTGQAVLELNKLTGSDRRFILIEQGNTETGDKYARTLTWLRLRNVITGEYLNQSGKFIKNAEPLGGGFEFRLLTKQVDAKTILAMKRDELIDIVITSHWDEDRRSSPNLTRIDDSKYEYLVGKDDRGEGYFLIWNGKNTVGHLDRDTYKQVQKDARKFGIEPPYNVYARYEVHQSPNVRFWKIPDKILAHLGLNENSDRFNEEEEEEM